MGLKEFLKKIASTLFKETAEILPDDTVVFIVGPSGSGKSWFFRELVKSEHVKVNLKGQEPCTRVVTAMRCHFEGIQSDFVIVDTPSFFTFVDPDGDVIMQQWMDARYTKKCAAAAILYMHNIAANKDDPNLAMKNHLGTFRRICPPGALVPRTVHVVSIIDRAIQRPVPGDKIEAWMQPLRQQAREEGASVFEQQFEGRPETAWNALRDLLDACVKMAPS